MNFSLILIKFYNQTPSSNQTTNTKPHKNQASFNRRLTSFSPPEKILYNTLQPHSKAHKVFTDKAENHINTEVKSADLEGRQGVYFMFQDNGACITLLSVRVFHIVCPQRSVSLAVFKQTHTGRDLSSIIQVEGSGGGEKVMVLVVVVTGKLVRNWWSLRLWTKL